jgi:hypothetical protein
MKKYFLFSFSFLASASLSAYEVYDNRLRKEEPEREVPFLMGPLLASPPEVIPFGHFNFQPYLFLTGMSQRYDSHWNKKDIPFFWITTLQFPLTIGFAPRMDIAINLIVNEKNTKRQKAWSLGDLQVGLDYQLFFESETFPDIKLSIRETFPTGKYNHLKGSKLLTDAGGAGSYQSQIGLSIGKLIQIRGFQYLSTRLALDYIIPSSVSISGFNAYGGEAKTKGIVYPAQQFSADLGLEYSFTRHWGVTLDVLYLYSPKTRFKGVFGEGIDIGTMVQWSLAPALEYNWSETIGVIAGYWFTVAGRNTSAFQSGVIAVNLYW